MNYARNEVPSRDLMRLQDVRLVGLPGAAWGLALALRDFRVNEDEGWTDEQSRKVVFEHEDRRINLTVVIKPAEPGVGLAAIRDDRPNRAASFGGATSRGGFGVVGGVSEQGPGRGRLTGSERST